MIAILSDIDAWAALLSLTALEIVLGIDNILFISILVSRCPPQQVFRARQIGLSLAFVFRIVLLFGLTWLMTLTRPLFSIFGVAISWRDIILIGGGLFLIAKATHEIHHEVEPQDKQADGLEEPSRFGRSHYWLCSLLPSISYSHLIRSSPRSAWLIRSGL